jgi:hypothetical protein
MTALQAIQCRDHDILIIADTDEIPHIDTIDNIRYLYSNTASPEANRVYKLFVDEYLYRFI